MVLDVEQGVDVIRQGFASRDICLVLQGHLELVIDGVTRKRVGPGEIIGEMAFFDSTGLRSASLKSATPCRLLHLRRSVVRRFAADHPPDSLLIYEALGEVLARRLAAANIGQ
jgi:CRP-like cAMP-binding protein